MVNAGRVLIIAKGEWSNLVNYKQLDLVSVDTVAYLARKASVGVNPSTDTQMEYWQPFGSVSDIATTETPGLVMPDGTTILIDSDGTIHAKVGTITQKQLAAGATSVTFTGLPTSGDYVIDFYTSTGINYVAIDTSTAGSVVLTFKPQSGAVMVYCRVSEV